PVEDFLRYTGVLKPEETYGDLATLTYVSGDVFHVNFGDDEIIFQRVGGRLLPGEYKYKEPRFPRMRINYKIKENGKAGVQYLYHVEPLGSRTMQQFLEEVKQVCPDKRVLPGDFSKVVVATEKTIYVE
ncbi:hypothetical protein FOZ63_012593, partial [Perkinsus olseni]